MRVIGLQTEDPRRYFEVLEILRAQSLRFVTLSFSDPTPPEVGVIITSEKERDRVDFDRVVSDPDPEVAVARAKMLMARDRAPREIRIGIDPGVRPGFAAVADGVLLTKSIAESPEAVGGMVEAVAQEYPDADIVVRIGHGDRTNRNRIFNALWDCGYTVEIVDERNTTRRSHTPDEDAAVEIAMTPGYRPAKRQETEPCPGEIRNIQRISRLESAGAVTVSKELAKKVAMGELTLEEAIEKQRSGHGGSR